MTKKDKKTMTETLTKAVKGADEEQAKTVYEYRGVKKERNRISEIAEGLEVGKPKSEKEVDFYDIKCGWLDEVKTALLKEINE